MCMRLFVRMYKKVMRWARTERALSIISFAESSFFPIPPDPVLINLTLEKPKRWKRYASVTTITSVLGGVAGYLIGLLLFEGIGGQILETYGLAEEFQALGDVFSKNALLAIFGAALTPIPYKVFTIAAGVFRLNLLTFLIASIVGRGLRFFAVAGVISVLGERYKDRIEKYIDAISVIILLLVVVVAILYSQLG